jgi:microcompartment protein CcmL/EutN
LEKALGFIETTGLTPAIAALDAMEKTSGVQLLQAEVNDLLGVCIKIVGPLAAVSAAIDAGRRIANQMGGQPVGHVINSADRYARRVIEAPTEYNPLIQQDVVWILRAQPSTDRNEIVHMANATAFALGFIETQGFTAVFEAIDTACKAANVEVVAKEKLGGGYVTVVIKGDVAAVKAAVDAGKQRVDGLGKLIAAHVIPRPSDNVIGLLSPLQK